MKTLFTAMFGTETNSFSPLPTGLRMFEETCLFRGANYGAEMPLYAIPLATWREMAAARGWRVVESLCAFAQPAGPTVRAVHEAFRDEILADLEAAMPVDAVLLSLHGAMIAEGYDDAEGDLLARIRAIVGPLVPIGAECDLHANISRAKCENATALVLFKEYPHVDVAERARELFTLIAEALEGKTRPVIGWFDCRMAGVFHTTRQPMRGFVDRVAALEGRDGVLSVSIAHGFPWADVADMGSKIIVVTDGDRDKADRLAAELGREFFTLRAQTQPPYITLDAAMDHAARHAGPRPLVLADVADNAGGGAASDSTFVLEAMLARGLEGAAIGMIWDPMAVRLAFEVGLGASLAIRLGGKLGPLSGRPLDVRARVVGLARDVLIPFGGAMAPAGDLAAFAVDGVAIVCSTLRMQCFSPVCFTAAGIDAGACRVLVVKSMQHFHAAFAPIAADILYVAASGSVSPDVTALPYRRARRDQWPFIENPFAAG